MVFIHIYYVSCDLNHGFSRCSKSICAGLHHTRYQNHRPSCNINLFLHCLTDLLTWWPSTLQISSAQQCGLVTMTLPCHFRSHPPRYRKRSQFRVHPWSERQNKCCLPCCGSWPSFPRSMNTTFASSFQCTAFKNHPTFHFARADGLGVKSRVRKHKLHAPAKLMPCNDYSFEGIRNVFLSALLCAPNYIIDIHKQHNHVPEAYREYPAAGPKTRPQSKPWFCSSGILKLFVVRIRLHSRGVS